MKTVRTLAAGLAMSLMAATLAAQETHPIRMPNMQGHYLQSEIMDYKYGIYITLPEGYAEQPDRHYPTVYIIDGNQYYGFTGEPYGSLIWGNMVKEHISVSVAYTAEGGNNRGSDFSPDRRAPDFVRFFREELIPFVEANYRTTARADRTLYGHSAGGRFTFFTLFSATDLFENYILSAPSVRQVIFDLEEEYAANHEDLPVTVYIASGEDDNLTIYTRMMEARLHDRKYSGLRMDSLYTPNGNHGTIQPTAYIEGLRYVLDPALDLVPAAYQRLVGSYRYDGGIFRISYEGGNYLRFGGVPIRANGTPVTEYQKLYARSENEFFPKGRPGIFRFGGDPGQAAESFSFSFEGQDIVATRTD
ncbi:MAG: alpha/beta hydrolase-fold protein [Gammaproteobacteria bacterium]|nr:alpha/beta hydrolase-fold protein [Gammaproteobacteria bacterium]MDH3373374.1 alpha/beta hydrolase-fold protein [Gammaproteobacteria bacterium]MDH3551494.1 alpha/beta hydrolase-fold protein [Gammaproteobacteria bacterium]